MSIQAPEWVKHPEKLQQYKDSSVIVKVSGSNLEKNDAYDLEAVCGSIVAMHDVLQAVNGRLVVVHGAGKQLDYAIKEAGLPDTKIKGLRWTDDELYEIVEQQAGMLSHEVAETLRDYGANPVQAQKGLIIAKPLGPEYGGRVGVPTGIDVKLLPESGVPMVKSLGIDYETGKGLNINADDVAAIVAVELNAKLLMNVTSVGGVLNGNQIAPRLSVEEAAKLSTNGMTVKVNAAKRVFELSPGTRVVVTSPVNMAYSLLETSGTMLYR